MKIFKKIQNYKIKNENLKFNFFFKFENVKNFIGFQKNSK